ncbi:MAG: GNAT family N-acetyltransferase [Eubacteriales bacterium]|nr:GNAT family N-acetyltransferase [Eubacteriales bacterium]MDD3880920.1 GNAT family N-acetyltransferase [Eubacteriales bacterium]MDD4511713.1 GNAT family N-acetyltransferase [Eubacteriales bacterium]
MLRVTNPSEPYIGLPPQDVFIASDETGMQHGSGYLLCFSARELFPEQPMQIYLHMEGGEEAYYLLFGALYARALQMVREGDLPPARLYTQLSPKDLPLLTFFSENGFMMDDAEDMVTLPIVPGMPAPLMTPEMSIAPVPLQTQQQQDEFLARLNQHRISRLTSDNLISLMQFRRFVAIGLIREGRIVGELLAAGNSSRSELTMMYILPQMRCQGYGTILLKSAMSIFSQSEIYQMDALVLRRNKPLITFMKQMGAQLKKTMNIYPGMDL